MKRPRPRAPAALLAGLTLLTGACARTPAGSAAEPASVLLVPLDDRPPCLQFVTLLAPVADASVQTPPRAALGRFLTPGRPEAISGWLDRQDLSAVDGVILSLDMLAYGGLVASRVPDVPLDIARRRVEAVRRLKARRPAPPVFASTVIMRLAPTADARNEAWREALARWAELSAMPNRAAEAAALARRIPGPALARYRQARRRNLAVNLQALDLVKAGAIDFLIVSQDDARPTGVHVQERERIAARVRELGIESRVALQPGADEVAMLLLARLLLTRAAHQPTIAVEFSDPAAAAAIAPFEDRPLRSTVGAHIAAAGAREAPDPAGASLLLFVRASRLAGGPGNPADDAARVARHLDEGRRVIVADVDMSGSVQGADPAFTDALAAAGVLHRLAGYAAWNTAGNTLGTAIPHGVLHALAAERLMQGSPERATRLALAQVRFLLHRLVDDDVYHGRVRRRVAQRFPPASDVADPAERARALEAQLADAMREPVARMWSRFGSAPIEVGAVGLGPLALNGFSFRLPWGRTFEAEIELDLSIPAAQQR